MEREEGITPGRTPFLVPVASGRLSRWQSILQRRPTGIVQSRRGGRSPTVLFGTLIEEALDEYRARREHPSPAFELAVGIVSQPRTQTVLRAVVREQLRRVAQMEDSSSSEDVDMDVLQTLVDPREVDEQDTDNPNDLLNTHGPLSVLLYSRIKSKNLFNLQQQDFFVEKFIDYYVNNIKEMNTSMVCHQSMQALVDTLPSWQLCARFIQLRRNEKKDLVLFKVIVDIMEHYYKLAESPLFSTYRREVIPIALAFYRSLSPVIIHDILDDLRACLTKSTFPCSNGIEDQMFVLLHKTPQKYLDYYAKEHIEYENLAAGHTRSLYFA